MYNVQVNSFQNITFDPFISLNIFLRQNFYMGNLRFFDSARNRNVVCFDILIQDLSFGSM